MNGNLAYQIASSVDDSRLYNNYANYDVVMQAAMGNAKVKKIISKEINDVITEGMDQELIDNYIKSLEAQSTFGKYSNSNIAFELGFAEYYYKDYNEYDAKLVAYKKIKGDDLKIIAQTYFNPEKLKSINIKPVME